MECAACGGRETGEGDGACPECLGRGWFELATCPLEWAGEEPFEVIEMADLWAKGIPPVAGGALDQAAVFVASARFAWAEKERWKAETMRKAWSDF